MNTRTQGRKPFIERDRMSTGLTGECAYVWCVWLANEADINGDYIAYDRWKHLADALKPKQGTPVPSSVHIADLEEEINKFSSLFLGVIISGNGPEKTRA